MSLQTRLAALITAVGADIKSLSSRLDKLDQKYAFKVYRNAAFTLDDGDLIKFDTAEYDPDGLFSLATWKFTAPRAGLWAFTAQYCFQGSPGALDTYFAVRGWKNGTGGTFYEGPRINNRGKPILPGATFYVAMAAGDTFQVHATLGAVVGENAINVGPTYTWLAGHQVRAT